MTIKNEIKAGSIISYLTVAINILLGLIYTPWTLDVIGSSEYGIYTLTSSLISIFLLDFGMSAAVARFISRFRVKNDQESINRFATMSAQFYLILCGIITVVLVFVFFFLGDIYDALTYDELEKLRAVFLINALFIVLSFPVNVCNGILTAYEKFIFLKSADIINKLGTVLITVIVLLRGGGLFALVFINGLLNFITFIVKLIMVYRVTPVRISFNKSKAISFKSLMSFSAWSTVNSVSQQLTTNLMPSILGMTSNTLAITIYGFARTIEGYVYTITQAINGLFLPTVSRLIADDEDARKTLPLMIRVGRLNHSVITLLLIGFLVLGQEFVNLWVGREYAVLYPCIMLLICPYYISASQQIAMTSIVVLNKLRYTSINSIVTSSICLLVAYFVSDDYGALGVCAVTSAGIFTRLLLANIIYKRVIKIDVFRFFFNCHLRMLLGNVLSLGGSFICVKLVSKYVITDVNWLTFFVKAGIISVIYVICMWLTAWNKEEKTMILSLLRIRSKNR